MSEPTVSVLRAFHCDFTTVRHGCASLKARSNPGSFELGLNEWVRTVANEWIKT